MFALDLLFGRCPTLYLLPLLLCTVCQAITLTTRPDVEATADVWPVTYPHLHSMVEEGDTIYIGR
jgi:hypothetical protein